MEFLELVETVRAEEASVQRLFGAEGERAGKNGRGVGHPGYHGRLAEAVAFVADIYEGRRPAHQLREALTTSDFPLLFGDMLDRLVLAAYHEAPQSYRHYCRVGTVRDFRAVSRHAMDGAEGVLAQVGEQGEYPNAKVTESRYQYAVRKYGRAIPFSFESLLNDDLDALRDIPARFGRAARRSEEKFVTELFVGSSGPLAAFYKAPNSNVVTGNPALSVSALQSAMQLMADQRDSDGEPILIEAVELVVPPALEITAQNILNALQLELTSGGGDAQQKLVASNWMRNRVRLSVNPYIPIVASTANGNSSWFLFANPAIGRPALEMGFLRGHAEPEIWIKEPNARRAGGGTVDTFAGDFDTDTIRYRVRHIFGGTRLDPRATVASNGSNG